MLSTINSIPIIRECEKTYKQTNCQDEFLYIFRDIICLFAMLLLTKVDIFCDYS